MNVINKIIGANLPQELSQYFLFDAMQTGKLVQTSELSQLITDNINMVMGLGKYKALLGIVILLMVWIDVFTRAKIRTPFYHIPRV